MNLTLSFDFPGDITEQQFESANGVTLSISGNEVSPSEIVTLLLKTIEQIEFALSVERLDQGEPVGLNARNAIALSNTRLNMLDGVLHMGHENLMEIEDER